MLIALYSVRSDRQFCEQLDYNILFRWFLDMNLESPTLDHSNFSRLRERLVATDVARRFFDEVVNLARKQKRNRSLSGVLFQPAPARNNPSHIHQGGAGSDQGDSDQQQVAAA